jgi:type IV secretion system protein VirB1
MLLSLELLQQCAPNVAPQTLAAIIQVESGGNPLALGVNGPGRQRPRPASVQQAAWVARYFIRQGYSVDLGLMQINSRNLPGLGYSIEQILDPCTNIHAGARILSRGYAGAARRYGPGQNALKAALSAYNTGNYEQGFRNGYVAKYYPQPNVRLLVKVWVPPLRLPPYPAKPFSKQGGNPYAASSTVFSRL